jgi:hypothetical protein
VETPETAKAEEIVTVSTPGTGDGHLFLRKYTGMHHWDRLSRRALHSAAIVRVAQAPSAPEQSWRDRGGRLDHPDLPLFFFDRRRLNVYRFEGFVDPLVLMLACSHIEVVGVAMGAVPEVVYVRPHRWLLQKQ